MYAEPLWNTTDNHTKSNIIRQQSAGYCLNCNKPQTASFTYCSTCNTELIRSGLERKRVRIGQVGRDTVNYQQYLHRIFFDCNAPVAYRGIKEDRIKVRIPKDTIERATLQLHNLLRDNSYTYNDKKINKRNYPHTKLYNTISDIKNIPKRLLYNIVLYHLSYYHNDNPEFISMAHFQSSMIQNLLINIENIHLRTQDYLPEESKKTRYKYVNKYYYWLYERITSVVSNVIGDMSVGMFCQK